MKNGTKKEKPEIDESSESQQPKTNDRSPPKTDAVKTSDERTVNLEDESNSSTKTIWSWNSLVLGFLIALWQAY